MQGESPLQFLSDHGLTYRWSMIDPPGLTRRPSMLLLTPRGGRLLAEFRGHSPWSYIRRAKDARDHCWHLTHDLEANGFFIDLALASRMQVDQGLLLWIGEESSRSSRRTWAKEHRRPIATPDGEGLYLSCDRTIAFDLEWDRGTESTGRLRSPQPAGSWSRSIVAGSSGTAVAKWGTSGHSNAAVDTELRPPVVMLDSRKSADGKDVLAICTVVWKLLSFTRLKQSQLTFILADI